MLGRCTLLLVLGSLLAGCAGDSPAPGDAAAASDTAPSNGQPDSGAANRPAGSACTDSAQCEGGVCLTEFRISAAVNYVMKNGYCSSPCSSTGPADDCGEGLTCLEAIPAVDQVKHYCFKECASPTDCRQSEGYECTPGGICFPKEPR